uniref:Acidic leucine-rich nuclear phosphoprotein 32-related protein 2-like n=1 Tax=Gongylonema pulchrum TaxID=637853 RepID=A0A183D0Z9_9BILA
LRLYECYDDSSESYEDDDVEIEVEDQWSTDGNDIEWDNISDNGEPENSKEQQQHT